MLSKKSVENNLFQHCFSLLNSTKNKLFGVNQRWRETSREAMGVLCKNSSGYECVTHDGP